MAMETVDNHLIVQFADMMHIKAQQMQARLRPYVQILQMDGDKYAYDGLGQVDARELTGRFNPTVFDDLEHLRRKISRRRFVVTLPIDKMDVEGRLVDPQGQYAAACVRAMERVFDKVVYQAMFADVATGRDFETNLTFAQDGGLTVTATSGLVYEKLLEIQQNWIDADVGNDTSVKMVLGITGDEYVDLMSEAEFTSRDFSSAYVIDKGRINQVMGVDLVTFGANARNPIMTVSGGIRNCFALAENGIAVGLSRKWEISVKDRPDLVDTTQVQITGVLGAVRTEGVLVQKVTTTD